MARSPLTNPATDLMSDSGSVLWSFIRGEQLEFPITLDFVEDVTAGYVYEAVVVEAANIANDTTRPSDIQPNGVQTKLVVRLPVKRGNWDANSAYSREEVALYNGKAYRFLGGIAVTSSITPDVSALWTETSLSRIYVQFPSTLGAGWNVTATVGFPTYAFFELRVTEPDDGIFKKTWKPVRGMVQIMFSPTELVPD